jgi:RNA polymerase subunit RPABC4/transcription elongation factor Spt4
MRQLWIVLTVLLGLTGFVYSPAWLAAGITGVLAVGSAPSGNREDDKPRSREFPCGLVFDTATSIKMMDCPVCRMKMFRDAAACPFCGSHLDQDSPDLITANDPETKKAAL